MGATNLAKVDCDAKSCSTRPLVVEADLLVAKLDENGWSQFVWIESGGDRGIDKKTETIFCPRHTDMLRDLAPSAAGLPPVADDQETPKRRRRPAPEISAAGQAAIDGPEVVPAV